MSTEGNSPHLPRLDGVRGIAIALVMFHHLVLYSQFVAISAPGKVVARLADASWFGVDIFFVLSGFLITGLLLDSRGSPGYAKAFYARRVLRIFPLYYAVLALCLLILPALLPGRSGLEELQQDAFWYWSYLINFQIALESWPDFLLLGHFWSLAIEEQFYLVRPLVVAVVSPRRLLRVCVALIVVAVGYRIYLASIGEYLSAYVLTVARMDALVAGAALAILMREEASRRWLAARTVQMLVLSLCLMGAIAVYQGGRYSTEGMVPSTIGLSATVLLGVALVNIGALGSPDGLIHRLLSAAWLRTLGKYSYGLYVVHQPLLILIPDKFRIVSMPQGQYTNLHWLMLWAVVYAGLCLGVAWLSYHLLEQPFLRLKSRFPYGRA